MQTVSVPGVGTLNFPDGMSQQDMAAAIYKNFPKLRPQTSQPQPAQPRQPSMPEDFDQQAEMLANQAILSGISEGAKRFWGGLKQAGADLSDLYHTYINPMVNPQTGAGIMPTAGAEATAAENARQAQAAQAAQRQFGPVLSTGQRAVADVTEAGLNAVPAVSGIRLLPILRNLLAGSVATEGALGSSTTFTGNIVRQAALGTLQELTAFSPTNSKARDAALAGGAGATLGLLNPVAAFNASLNHIRNAIQKFGGRSEAAYQAAKAIMGWGTPEAAAAGIQPTIAMRSGAPMARTFEKASFGGQIQDRYANIRDHLLLRFRDVFGLPQHSVESPVLDGAYHSAVSSAEGTIKALRRQASDAYTSGMNEAIRLAGAGGGGNPRLAQVEVPELRSILNEIMGNQSEQLVEHTDLDLSPISRLRESIDKQSGRLTTQDIAVKLRAWSQLTMQSKNASEIAIINKARSALYNDIDAYIKDGGAASPALQKILQTRAEYRQAMEQVEALQNTAAYRFLGVNSPQSATPDALIERFSAFAPAKQREIVDYLHDNSPQLLQLMRRKTVQDVVNTAVAPLGPASDSEVNLNAMFDKLYGKDGVLRTSGLWNAKEQEQMERFRQAAKVVMNVSQPTASGAGLIVGPAEIAPNIISHSPIFIARQLARVLQLSHGADIFTDPTLFDELMKVRKTSGAAQTAARSALSTYIAKTYGVGSGEASQ